MHPPYRTSTAHTERTRAQILDIRNKIQSFFGSRFRTTRQLFGALDLDRDGEVGVAGLAWDLGALCARSSHYSGLDMRV